MWRIDPAQESTAPAIGTAVREGDTLCHIQAYYGLEGVRSHFTGKLVSINARHGETVEKGEIIAFVE